MKQQIILFFFLAAIFLVLASCDPAPVKESNQRLATPTKPSAATNPMATTQLPPSPQPAAAPVTYSSTYTPKGVEAAPTTYASAAAVAAPIIGNWVNTEEPDETVVFTDHSYETYYQGQKVVEEEMTYHPNCPADCSGGQSVGIPCFTISSQYGKDCFGILRITENELELTLLGVSTATILYRRIQP